MSGLNGEHYNNLDFMTKEIERLQSQNLINSEISGIIAGLTRPKPNSILDIGCGIGQITKDLAMQFPNSTVTGIDICTSFIEIAKKHAKDFENLTYVCGDVFTESADLLLKNSDTFVLRFVVQHLGVSRLNELLKKIKNIKKNSFYRILIVDTDDRMWVFEPESSAIKLALASANSSQKKYGGDREIGCKIPIVAANNNLSIKKMITTTFSSAGLGQESFDKIVEPLFSSKIDPDYLNSDGVDDLLKLIAEWKKIKSRFCMGVTLTYLLETTSSNE